MTKGAYSSRDPLHVNSRRRRRGAALALSAMLAACGGPPDMATVRRLADPAATERLAIGRLDASRPEMSWRFSTPSDAAGWRLAEGDGVLEQREGALVASRPVAGLTLEPEARVDPVLVDALQVVVAAAAGPVEVSWGPAAAPAGRVRAAAPEMEGGRLTYDLRVGPHPGWGVAPVAFRLHFPEATRVAIGAVHALDEELRPEVAGSVVARTFRVTLGGRERPARLGIGAVPIDAEVTLPEGGLLRLALGLTPGHPVAATFRVASGDATLLERRVEEGGVWEEHEVVLPPSPEPRSLRLSVAAGRGRLDPVKGFPVWGDLEILAPGES